MSYNAELYKHELDRRATKALEALPKVIKLSEFFMANVDEKTERMVYLGETLRLSEKQMPEIYELLPPICEKLGIKVPELYYYKAKWANAWTFGTVNPYICVTSSLVKKLSKEELSSVLAHECGHIACKHTLYRSLAWFLSDKVTDAAWNYFPGISRYFTRGVRKALLFWDRCSELSADRAAVLCSGSAEPMIRSLLHIHGYKDVNIDEYMKQAMDLNDFINESAVNKTLNKIETQWDTHPRLATRAYESYCWTQTEQYHGILDGSYTLEKLEKELEKKEPEEELVAGDVQIQGSTAVNSEKNQLAEIEEKLSKINKELERYTCNADKMDYMFAVASGLCAGIIDSIYVGEFSLDKAHEWGSEKTERFVLKVAKSQGFEGEDKKAAIVYLAEQAEHGDHGISNGFHLAADSNTNDFGGGIQHHLRDFAHHASITGLIFSMLTQFTKKCYGTDTSGKFIVVDVRSTEFIGKDIQQKFVFGTLYWFFHMVSDVAGSGTLSEGTGVPGPILSTVKLLSATPLFKNSVDENGRRNLSVFVSKLFNGTFFGERDENGKLIPLRFDFRTELGIAHHIAKQVLPVILNEVFVRGFYFIRRFAHEVKEKEIKSFKELDGMDWNVVKPSGNRTIERMLTVSTITFTVADTADAAIHAALESLFQDSTMWGQEERHLPLSEKYEASKKKPS